MTKETILIGSDPSGFTLKEAVKAHLVERGFEVADVGTQSLEEPVMYYDVGERFGRAISEGTYQRGIVICGTGMGVNLMVNRFPGVLCGLCESVYAVSQARAINNINVLAMGGFFQAPELGIAMADAFLDTQWLQGLDEETQQVVKNGYARTKAVEAQLRK